MQAGCDVYAEKPQSLTIAEGRILAKAVRKYNRVLQTGSQQRSMPINVHASKLVREGAIGKVHTVITCNFKGGKAWTNKPEEPIPSGLDWDQWCNQTALRPYHSELQNAWSFFDCIRARKTPHASVEIGHRATTVCHLVNMCRTVQRKLRWDPKAEKFIGDEAANNLLSRPRRKGYELPKIA